MGGYLLWMWLGIAALVALALLLFVPGLWVLALLALAVAIIGGAAWLAARGVEAAADTDSDVEQRRAEHLDRQASDSTRRRSR